MGTSISASAEAGQPTDVQHHVKTAGGSASCNASPTLLPWKGIVETPLCEPSSSENLGRSSEIEKHAPTVHRDVGFSTSFDPTAFLKLNSKRCISTTKVENKTLTSLYLLLADDKTEQARSCLKPGVGCIDSVQTILYVVIATSAKSYV
eukprot:gnl/TRDRNA2_/TRDRNA2_58849_c0_seq1.p1 gnl/TRDRNA2_/TRDRNA2_58849_c0~~gnl/TRDRNA2_/TRDRNA2_58849_c0_seq1.p1  ORF type:complete len:149 (-),score=4.21 gnl/TRDRNA2_/TRDRNA2_58849_c0_seq1:73-519(-)